MISKKILYKALEDERSKTSFFLFILIVLNIIGLLLESISSLREAYGLFFIVFELISIFIFLIEYFARFFVSGMIHQKYQSLVGKIRFFFTPLMLLDMLSILTTFSGFDLRVLRMIRILRLYRYSIGIKTMIHIAKEKKREFASVFSILLLAMLIFATCLYHLEHTQQPEAFSSIPAAMWWAIATLTTVGYGDLTPITPLGKIFGAITSVLGILMFALPTAIISSSFLPYYHSLLKEKKKLKEKRKKKITVKKIATKRNNNKGKKITTKRNNKKQ